MKRFAAGTYKTLVALSLYPHFSCATSGSSLKELKHHLASLKNLRLVEIASWPDQPAYIGCLAERITRGLKQFQGQDVELLYSAH